MDNIPNIVGLTVDEAEALLNPLGMKIRVTRFDGIYRVVAKDCNPDRVNVETESGIIINQMNG